MKPPHKLADDTNMHMHRLNIYMYTIFFIRGLASVFTEMADEVPEKDRLKDLRGLTPNQLEFFRAIIENIVSDNCGKLGQNKALNLRNR
jgi:hypothetical protein